MLLKMFTDPLDTLKILHETFLGHNQTTLSFEKSILLIRKTKKKGEICFVQSNGKAMLCLPASKT